ncbi:MAG TPA: ribonuclease III [Pirellulaceae bacterium]
MPEDPILEEQVVQTDPDQLGRILEACQHRLGYVFQDSSLLKGALTHASRAQHRLASNERLEFLGDAVLGMVVCEYLYHTYPDLLEGELTRIKSVVVSRRTCAETSQQLGLEEFLFLGKGMRTQKALPPSLLSDVFESIIASIYLDGGWAPAREFLHRHIIPRVPPLASGDEDENYKSLLQQWAQRELGATPSYVLMSESGPDHLKTFRIAAKVGDLHFEPAWGNTKKQAAQLAARNALHALDRKNKNDA